MNIRGPALKFNGVKQRESIPRIPVRVIVKVYLKKIL